MKTYAETCNVPATDWLEILKGIKNLEYDIHEISKIATDSCRWVTCAVGNQCASIPRLDKNGAPVDSILLGLGIRFANVMHKIYKEYQFLGQSVFDKGHLNKCVRKAYKVLAEIEERASVLLSEVK